MNLKKKVNQDFKYGQLKMGVKDKNILLVEDSSDDMELIKRKLESFGMDYNLIVERDGEEALNYLYHKEKYSDREKFPDPDLILMDIKMPKINGIEVLREIKSDKILSEIPVVMLTASTLYPDIQDSFDGGCDNYVAKSVGFEKFEETIKPLIKYYLMK